MHINILRIFFVPYCIIRVERGHELAIINGRLIIHPSSDLPVPDEWLGKYAEQLIAEVVKQLSLEAYTFDDNSTGHYTSKCFSGVTLQFRNILTGKYAYAVFNAKLDRARNTKGGNKGTPLPKGQFRVGKRSAFCLFWQNSGAKFPPRLSSFHDYLGNLKGIIFSGRVSNANRLIKDTIVPLHVSAQKVLKGFGLTGPADNDHTNSIQHPDNILSRSPDRELAQTPGNRALQSISPACKTSYGLGYQGGAEVRETIPSLNPPICPSMQTDEEWLADYSGRYYTN